MSWLLKCYHDSKCSQEQDVSFISTVVGKKDVLTWINDLSDTYVKDVIIIVRCSKQ